LTNAPNMIRCGGLPAWHPPHTHERNYMGFLTACQHLLFALQYGHQMLTPLPRFAH